MEGLLLGFGAACISVFLSVFLLAQVVGGKGDDDDFAT